MSSTVVIPPAPAGARRANPPNFAIWIGAMIALVGAVVALSGGAVLALFGGDDSMTSGRESLSTSTAALVTGSAHIEDVTGFAELFGDPRISIDADSGSAQDLFVGVGPAEDVEAYLAGAPIEEVTDFDMAPFKLDRQQRAGTEELPPPTDQPFWVASSTGHLDAGVDWKVRNGDYRVVVMNADGSSGVKADGHVGVTVPHLAGIAGGIGIAGLLILAGGVVIVVVASRRRMG
jgi:hypothetical protein